MNILRMTMKKVLEEAGAEGVAAGGGGSGAEGAPAEGAAPADVEERARSMGWSPKDQWRGAPESWIDAGEYVRRGEQILPILRSNLQRTESELAKIRADHQKQSQLLQAANESIQVLTNLSTEQSRQAAKERRRELLRQQAQARSDGNADLEIDLGEQIADATAEINAAEEAAAGDDGGAARPTAKRKGARGNGAAAQPAAEGPDPTADPAYQAFVRDNPWFGTDRRKSALAIAVGQELRSDPANSHLQGEAFFQRVVQEVNKVFAPSRSTSSRVEGSGGGAASSSGQNGDRDPASGKSFADLPADAKAACERQANWVVGEGRAFKDIAAWRKHYVTQYFNS